MHYWLLATIDLAVGLAVFYLASRSARPGASRETAVPRRVSRDHCASTTLATAVTFAVKVGLVGRGFFSLIHHLYLALVFTTPCLCAAILVSGLLPNWVPLARRLPRWLWCLASVGLISAAVGIYASAIEPYRLQVESARIVLPTARTGQTTFEIGVLADLQTDRVTAHEKRAVAELMKRAPELILLPGDLFQGNREEFERELPALRRLLGQLSAPAGVFFVPGNTDRSLDDLRRVFDGTNVELLLNTTRALEIGDRRVLLAGVDAAASRTGRSTVIRELESRAGAEDIRILLGHYPDMVLDLTPASRVDVVIAGHTHGGQVQIPGLGPPLVLSRVPRRVGAGGLHSLEGRRIYVSRGVGMERGEAPRIRFWCPPEVAILRFETQAER